MKYPKRSQYKHAKSQYRVSNWPEYEAGLQRRGDLTMAPGRRDTDGDGRDQRFASVPGGTKRASRSSS